MAVAINSLPFPVSRNHHGGIRAGHLVICEITLGERLWTNPTISSYIEKGRSLPPTPGIIAISVTALLPISCSVSVAYSENAPMFVPQGVVTDQEPPIFPIFAQRSLFISNGIARIKRSDARRARLLNPRDEQPWSKIGGMPLRG